MDYVVLNTDVVSFYFKNDPRVAAYKTQWDQKTLVISFMTLAELRLWMLVRNWGQQRIDQLEEFIQNHFVFYPVDDQLCRSWANLMADSRARGLNLHTADAWIAATALAINAPLATHNRKDYLSIPGLQLLS